MTRTTGSVLLELLVAMLILAVTSAGVLHSLSQAMATQAKVAKEEEYMSRASRLLSEHTLLAAAELDQRLGGRIRDGFRVTVQRPAPRLYRIGIGDTSSFAAEELVSVVAPEAQ